MAEIVDDLGGLIDDAEDGVDGELDDAEGDDEISEEDKEELKEESKEAKENLDSLDKTQKELKEAEKPTVLKKFATFIGEQIAIATLMFGVNMFLSKLIKGGGKGGSGDTAANKRKLAQTKALSALVKDLCDTSKKLITWLTAKENVDVEVGYGIEVPLPDIFTKFMKGIQTNLDTATRTAKTFMNTNVKPPTFNVPTSGQISQIITSTQGYIDGLQKFIKFAASKASKFPDLNSLPIKQADIDTLNKDIAAVKALPS